MQQVNSSYNLHITPLALKNSHTKLIFSIKKVAL
jgi:hypothetical protein